MSERDPLEAVFLAAAARALRRRARVLLDKAAPGIATTEAGVAIVESKAAHALRIARDWDAIAAELESEAT